MVRWEGLPIAAIACQKPEKRVRFGTQSFTAMSQAALLMSLVAGGCRSHWESDYTSLQLLDVSGKITFDGRPLTNASVIFEGPDRSDSRGITDEAGRYRLQFDSHQAGVLPGPKVVRIRQDARATDSDEARGERTNRTVAQQREIVPACYNSASQLRAVVTEDSPSLDFHLRSDCTVTGPVQ